MGSRFAPCSGCGRVIARDVERCPYCRVGLDPDRPDRPPRLDAEEVGAAALDGEDGSWAGEPVDPGGATHETAGAASVAAPAGDALPAAADGSKYRSISGYTRALQLMFPIWMAITAVGVGSNVAVIRLVTRAEDNPFTVSMEQLEAGDERGLRLGIVVLAAQLVIGIIFIAWLFGGHRNLRAFGLTPKYKSGWAIGGWFVPFLNLARPKQIVDEVWAGSDPAMPSIIRTVPHRRGPALFAWWWGTYLVSTALVGWGGFSEPTHPSEFRSIAAVRTIGAVLELAAAGFTLGVIAAIDRRQAGRAAALGFAPGRAEPVSGKRRNLAYAGLGVMAAAVAIGSLLAFDADPVGTAVTGTIDGASRRYEGYGVAFDYPHRWAAAEVEQQGVISHSFGQVAAVSPDGETGVVVTWTESLRSEVARADLEAGIGFTIDGIATEEGTVIVRRGDLVDSTRAGFVVQTFTSQRETVSEHLSAAIAAGGCPGSDRVLSVIAFESGLRGADSAFRLVESTLESVDC